MRVTKSDERIIEFLNEMLTYELTLINQYWLNYRMHDNWGLPGLAKVYKDLAVEEMEDADHYVERILYLDGHPNLQRLNTVQVGEDPLEQLRLARDAERTAVERLNAGIALCVEVGDNGTRELLAEAVREEEQHLDFFDTELQLVERIGEQHYLARYATPEST
jgi:bacterioferritin